MIRVIRFRNRENQPVYTVPYFPVGFIYISFVEIDLSVYFGGVWERIEDVFLLAAGKTYKAGSKGGSATHTLSIEEMPSHNHYIRRPSWYFADFVNGGEIFTPNGYKTSVGIDHYTNSVGGSKAHNNMPPYITVYIYRKVSN